MPAETSWHWVLSGATGFLSALSVGEAPGTGRRPREPPRPRSPPSWAASGSTTDFKESNFNQNQTLPSESLCP